MRKTTAQKGNPELIQALTEIEKEKDIDKEILFEAIENSLPAKISMARLTMCGLF